MGWESYFIRDKHFGGGYWWVDGLFNIHTSTADDQVAYAVVSSWYYETEIHKTVDGGKTWTPVTTFHRDEWWWYWHSRPQIKAIDRNKVYVLSNRIMGSRAKLTFSKSADGGATWKDIVILTDPPFYYWTFRVSLSVADENNIYVFYTNHDPTHYYSGDLYCAKSSDAGETWTKTKITPDPAYWWFLHQRISTCAIDANTAYVLYSKAGNGRRHLELAVTKDGGNTWTQTIVPRTVFPYLYYYYYYELDYFWDDFHLSVAPNGKDLYIVSTTWVSPFNYTDWYSKNYVHGWHILLNKSHDGGLTWTESVIDTTGYSYMPSVCVDSKGIVYVQYAYTHLNNYYYPVGNTQWKMAISLDEGATWGYEIIDNIPLRNYFFIGWGWYGWGWYDGWAYGFGWGYWWGWWGWNWWGGSWDTGNSIDVIGENIYVSYPVDYGYWYYHLPKYAKFSPNVGTCRMILDVKLQGTITSCTTGLDAIVSDPLYPPLDAFVYKTVIFDTPEDGAISLDAWVAHPDTMLLDAGVYKTFTVGIGGNSAELDALLGVPDYVSIDSLIEKPHTVARVLPDGIATCNIGGAFIQKTQLNTTTSLDALVLGVPDFIYYDRFENSGDASSHIGYTLLDYEHNQVTDLWDKILFVPGRPLQSAELNEVQSMFVDKLKRFSDLFMSDGSVISGCNIILPAVYPGTVSIEKGYIYVNGRIIYVEPQDVLGTFTAQGDEWIYLNVIDECIMEIPGYSWNDPILVDPDVSDDNYGEPGAHRRILKVQFVHQNLKISSSIRFFKLISGIIPFARPNFGADKIVHVLEKRTYDVSGNFLVTGGQIRLSQVPDDTTKYRVVLEPFEAYLNGVQLTSTIPFTQDIDKCLDTYSVQDFLTVDRAIESRGGLSNNVFELENRNVEKITTVIYPAKQTFTMTHMIPGGVDAYPLPPQELITVLTVKQGNITYSTPSDYVITNYGISWSPHGLEPSSASTYTAELVYYKTVSLPTTLWAMEYPNSASGDYSFSNLVISDTNYYGTSPLNVVNIEYNIYKFRKDAVVLNTATGLLSAVLGEPTSTMPYRNPNISNDMFLMYLIETVPGENADPITYNAVDKRVTRLTQAQMNSVNDVVRNVQFAQSFSKLDDDAASTPVTGLMNGIYTDSLDTLDQSDIGFLGGSSVHWKNHATGDYVLPSPYDAGFDDSTLTLSLLINNNSKTPSVGTSTLELNSKGVLYTLPYTEVLEVAQPLATTLVDVQPYIIPTSGQKITITPTNDIWIDTDNVTIVQTTNEQVTGGGAPQITSKTVKITTVGTSSDLSLGDKLRNTQTVQNTAIMPTDVSSGSKVATNVRPRTIHIKGENWYVLGDPANWALSCSVGDVDVPGFSDNFTIQPDYTFEGNFTIPSGVPSGLAPVRVWTTPYYLEADTDYFCYGIVQSNVKIEENVNITKVPNPVPAVAAVSPPTPTVRPRPAPPPLPPKPVPAPKPAPAPPKPVQPPKAAPVAPNPPRATPPPVKFKPPSWTIPTIPKCASGPKSYLGCDPIAESFVIDDDCFITSIGIYVSAKSSTDDLTCFLVETDNGYPTNNVVYSCVLSPSSVNISSDSSNETKFVFSDPVYIRGGVDYAFIIFSTSPDYVVWVAQQGQSDRLSGNMVISQPYNAGVFFKSANHSTWGAFQDMDLKFNIYRAEFSTSGELDFLPQTIQDSWLSILADAREYHDTTLTFQYKFGSQFNNVRVAQKVKLLSTGLANQCTVRVLMSTNNTRLSPVLNKEIGTLYWHYNNLSEWYSGVIDFGAGSEFDNCTIRLSAATLGLPFKVRLICSIDKSVWYEYISDEFTLKTTPIDLNIGSYEYLWTFNMSDKFNGLNLARYMRINIELGNLSYDGSDTPHIFDLRAVAFEKIV
jgi:hypothetical protein